MYSIEVWEHNNRTKANCDCPFDGYPCKHIVAVLLYFLNNKDDYLKKLEKEQKIEARVRKQLFSFKKAELINIIISLIKKYPQIKRELFLHTGIDIDSTLKEFLKEVNKILRAFERETISTYDLSHQLKEIIKQVENADYDIKIEILCKITDGILYQLNEYGMDDTALENTAIDTMDLLVQTLNLYAIYYFPHLFIRKQAYLMKP